MSIKEKVDQLYAEHTGSTPKFTIMLTSALKYLSSDLYTDTKRFIYELLQNADDSAIVGQNVDIAIKLFDDTLVIAHTGQSFTDRDIEGLCDIDNGTKIDDTSKTGYKGIGFKSVFGQSQKVTIFTNYEYFKFDAKHPFEWKTDWGMDKESWEKENNRKLSYPWQIIPIYLNELEDDVNSEIQDYLTNEKWNVATILKVSKKEEIVNAINELSSSLNKLLFLQNINSIKFETDKTIFVEIEKNKNQLVLKKDNIVEENWLTKTIQLPISKELKTKLKNDENIPKKLQDTDEIKLTLATKKIEHRLEAVSNNENLIYAYLPTSEKKYSFPILVNSTFLMASNRENLHTDLIWNEYLFNSISKELFHWIAELVQGKYAYDAYNLIPKKLDMPNDKLAIAYDKGIDEAIESISFILSKNKDILKVSEAIIDETDLSEKTFIGKKIIKKFLKHKIGEDNKIVESPFVFANKKLKKIGVKYFSWDEIPALFAFDDFKTEHTVEKNIQLIEYFKNESEIINSSFPKDKLKSWTFLYDHKAKLNYPNKICFPKIDDENWNNPKSELSYVNETLYDLVISNLSIKSWLQALGVQEKTDITYLTTIIIPHAESYITHENNTKTIKYIYELYSNQNIKDEILKQLNKLKLLTTKGTLIAASECYFSDNYNPKLKIENHLNDDIFLSKDYLDLGSDIDEVRRFFKKLGVYDDIKIIKINEKTSKQRLLQEFKTAYFSHSLNTYGMSTDSYKNIVSLELLNKTNNFEFSRIFWNTVIETINVEILKEKARGYWGHSGMSGQSVGSVVENYVSWYIKDNQSIPTRKGSCEKSIDVFLNTEEIKEIVGKYLPVFEGIELNQDWKSFFNFKTLLELDDYLELLINIMSDKNNENKIKKENKKRVQLVYKALLEQSTNWGTEEIDKVKSWATTAFLTDEDDNIVLCSELNYYVDGDNSIFPNTYKFITLDGRYKSHPNIETFLGYLGVEILRQDNFNIDFEGKVIESDLKYQLESIFPYLEKWIQKLDSEFNMVGLDEKLNTLQINEVSKLLLVNNGTPLKTVQVHLKEDVLLLTTPWSSNTSMLELPKILCRYLDIKGYEDKLAFLLKSDDEFEIREYFTNEEIELPIIVVSEEKNTYKEEILTTTSITEKEYDEITNDFFYSDKDKYEYIKKLLPRAKSRVLKHLESLDEYNCDNVDSSLPTVLSGITKNGNNIYIIPRPSDNNKVHLYYSSELDTLEYSDSELWYENGISIPKKLTFGKVLRDKNIKKIIIRESEQEKITDIINNPKNEEVAYTALPPSPFEIAKTMASLANTHGGYFIIGYSEENGIVEFSTEFNVTELTKKAIEYSDYFERFPFKEIEIDTKTLFITNIEKSEEDILIDDKKYVRIGSIIEEELESNKPLIITEGKTDKTILEIAWKKLYTKEMPFVIQSSGVEIDEEKREGSADSVKRTIELMSGTFDKDRILIGLFDNDNEGNNNFKGLTKKAFEKYNISLKQRKHLTKNIYALLLPIPEFRKIFVSEEDIGQRMFVIEHYFTNEILQRHQMKGKSLFGSEVFKVNNGKAKFSRDIEKLDKEEFENFKSIFDVIKAIIND